MAGGGGYLEQIYNQITHSPVEWVILEPNPAPIENCRAIFERGFFNSSYKLDPRYDTVIFSHLFEHMYEPSAFMGHLGKEIEIGKKIIFSVPDMQKMLKNKQSNTLNFEHTFFLAEVYVDYLLAQNGFEILEKKRFMDHSIFYAAIRSDSVKPLKLSETLYDDNKKLFMEYISDYRAFVNQVNDTLDKFSENAVYLFGAHLFSQFLLKFGIDETRIAAILDNDTHKQGKRLQGSNLRVFSPKILEKDTCPIVILRTGTYQEEIKRDILVNINSNTIILE